MTYYSKIIQEHRTTEEVEDDLTIALTIQTGAAMKMWSRPTPQILFFGGPQLELSHIDDGNLAETGKTFTKIFNLSNRKLNDIEKSVLMMGLKFTPTPEKIFPANWMIM